MLDWKALKKDIDDEAARSIENCPDDILRVFEYEIIRTGAGTGGLTMGPWFEGASASRYLGAYYCYNIVKLARTSDLSVDKIKYLVRLMLKKVLGTVELIGMETYASFAARVMACIEEMDDREDILELINSLYLYGSCINAWQNYRIKWGIGQAFRIPLKEDLKRMGELAEKSYE